MYRLRRRVFRQAVHQFLPPRADLEILDIGSGTGFYLDRWQELGFPNVHASDVLEVAVERLGSAIRPAVTQLDIAGLREPCQPGEAGRAVGLIRELRAPPQSEKAQQVNRSLVEIESLLRKVGFEPLERRPMFVLMNFPLDSTSRVQWLCWRVLVLAMAAWNPLGAVLGAVLYPLELALVARMKEGPSTELMLCRRLLDP
jgi:hypothetical protein